MPIFCGREDMVAVGSRLTVRRTDIKDGWRKIGI